MALSLSPFTLNQFDAGYTFQVGNKTATTPAQLQQIYKDLGSTEMYVRLATKRHKTYKPDGSLDNTTDGKPDENAKDDVVCGSRSTASLPTLVSDAATNAAQRHRHLHGTTD